MHIMEGFLPVEHALGWSIAAAPFVALGLRSVRRQLNEHPEQRMLLGVAAAFSFVLSALKLPSVTGSCSHPTGTGLGALLFGPAAMAPIGILLGLQGSQNPFSGCASYKDIAHLPAPARAAAMRDAGLRARILSEDRVAGSNFPLITRLSFERMFPFGDPPDYAPPKEASIAAMADRR